MFVKINSCVTCYFLGKDSYFSERKEPEYDCELKPDGELRSFKNHLEWAKDHCPLLNEEYTFKRS